MKVEESEDTPQTYQSIREGSSPSSGDIYGEVISAEGEWRVGGYRSAEVEGQALQTEVQASL